MCSEHVSDDLELNGKVSPRHVWGSLTLGRVTLRRKILGLGTGIRGKCDNGTTSHLSHLGSEGATDKWEVPKCPGGRPESESIVLFRLRPPFFFFLFWENVLGARFRRFGVEW